MIQMTAALLRIADISISFATQTQFSFIRKVPAGAIVLCVSEYDDYLEVLYNGKVFSVDKTSVVPAWFRLETL